MKTQLKFIIVTKKGRIWRIILKMKMVSLTRCMFIFWFNGLLDIKNEVIELNSID